MTKKTVIDKVLGTQILAKRRLSVDIDRDTNKTKSGIIMPDSVIEKGDIDKCEGVILKKGDGVSSNLNVGDLILFGKNSAASIWKEYGHDLFVIYERDVVAVLKDIEKEEEN